LGETYTVYTERSVERDLRRLDRQVFARIVEASEI